MIFTYENMILDIPFVAPDISSDTSIDNLNFHCYIEDLPEEAKLYFHCDGQ